MDQIIIGDLSSYDDFGASVAARKISLPAKKSIKETVPYSNLTYDFSGINGEVYWEERELEYVFELTADTPEELEEGKRKFSAWVMGVQEQDLHDPFIPDYHFRATYAEMDPEDDEGLDKTTVTVKFTAYPYMIADQPIVHEFRVEDSPLSYDVFNPSVHPVPLTVSCNEELTLTFGGYSYTTPKGTATYDAIKLPTGWTTLALSHGVQTAVTTAQLSFNEEVF